MGAYGRLALVLIVKRLFILYETNNSTLIETARLADTKRLANNRPHSLAGTLQQKNISGLALKTQSENKR
jgi:hypothetical protein